MIHIARVVDLEVSVASFGMLEGFLLKPKLVGEKTGDVEKVSGLSSFPGRDGTVVSESVVSRSVSSVPTISKSAEGGQVADIRSQETCSSLQADEALSSAPRACSLSETDSSKTFKEITADSKNPWCCRR